ncbi:MAG: M48 family metallopeptidase [Treponema sp.]|nr:M48 family metallopeptidase [Treponema sp.]
MLIVSGLPVEVNKRNVKTMRLCIKPDGKISVTAPLSMANYEIESFVHSKTDWIKQNLEKFKKFQNKSKREYVSGESFFVWGEEYNLQIKSGGKNSIVLSGDKAVFTVKKGITNEKREKFIRDWLKKLLNAEIEKALPRWEKKTSLKAASWQTKYMKTKWGSCKPRLKNICLNVRLAKYNRQCLDYIILHELMHFIEKGHNARFKSLLDKYMPDWRDIKKALNKQEME